LYQPKSIAVYRLAVGLLTDWSQVRILPGEFKTLLDLNKIQLIARSYSLQELFAALVWQRQFNEFDGGEVITDLSHHSNLWAGKFSVRMRNTVCGFSADSELD